MKRFYHPFLKDTTVTTSDGKLVLDKDGSAEVDDKTFDDLMKIPCNAEHQAKLDAQNPSIAKPIVPTLEEYVKAGYHAENYEFRFCGFKAGDIFDEEEIRKNQEEFLKQKEEDLNLLELPDLMVIAKQHKVKFAKTVTKPELIISIMDEIKKPPPPPPNGGDQG